MGRTLRQLFAVALGAATIASCDRGGAEAARAAVPPQGQRDGSLTAAHRDSIARARSDSANRAQPGYVVDSILPIDEQLRRFREGLPETRSFAQGARSRRALLDSIGTALSRSDTAGLRRLTMSRAEFAWLVYPSSPFVDGAMRQAPQVAWFMLSNASATGFTRVLDRLGGVPQRLAVAECADPPVAEGDNRVTAGCVVRWRGRDGLERSGRLWSALIERGGVWKVMNWANDF